MRYSTIAVLAMLPLAGTVAAAPFEELFQYDRDRKPVSGDCRALSAAVGAEAVWYGEYSGKRYDDFNERLTPYYARGCFETEFACRVWQNQAMTYSERGPTYWTRCVLGAPG